MQLKILSYNVHKGRAFFSRQKTWQAIDELLHEHHPDIVFLQEFLYEKESEKLLEKLMDKLWPHYSWGKNATTGNSDYGNAILSKFPILEDKNTDISTNALEKRGLLYAKVQPKLNENLHLFCSHINLTEAGRKKQLAMIQKIISQRAGDERFILAGDFNDWNEKLHPEIQKTLCVEEIFEKTCGQLLITSPSIYPMFSLDRIYYRGILPLEGRRIDHKKWRLLSDHLPILASIDCTT